MFSVLRSVKAALSITALLTCLFTFTEAKLRLPYTTPVIQTSHRSVVDPETGNEVAVFPVNFTVTVADCFSHPVTLINGDRLKGDTILPTHVFTGASLKLVFDVPNPGLDFVINLTSAEYPVLQDQYGSLWKHVWPSNIEVIKQDSKYTYDVGSVGLTSYQSQSESVVTPLGTPQYDTECYVRLACCGLNTTNYRKYSLVDSPVPAYACTSDSILYRRPCFVFVVKGLITRGSVTKQNECRFKASDGMANSVTCTNTATVALNGIGATPAYSTPSSGFLLCRQGSNLTDPTYEASPIPVVLTAFCSYSTCVGYTYKNYMNDRLGCEEHSLGYYTSLDGNNSNQFSFYEDAAQSLWEANYPKLRWIDDVGMSSSSAINNISFQRDVPASTGWSLADADFPLPLTDTLQPLFPIGRPTRVTARPNNAAAPTAVIVTVEYVSFSNFTAANWTIQTCVGTLCGSSKYPAASESSRYPTIMNATVYLTSLGLAPQLLPSEVIVTVTCETTPIANPFHTLLRASTVAVGAAILPSATKTVNASLAREPPQNVPSPYAAALGARATSRIICQGDYRFSTTTGSCVPLTDRECAIKYRGRRIVFNTTTNTCVVRVPKLTSPLVYRPLPDPLPPPKLTEESIRALMKSLRLPKFMKTMEEAIKDHDAKLASEELGASKDVLQAAVVNVTTRIGAKDSIQNGIGRSTVASAATSSDSKSSLPKEYPGFYPLCVVFFVVTGGTWIFILFRDVFYMLGGVKEWSTAKRKATQRSVPPRTPTSVSPAAQTPPTRPVKMTSPRPAEPVAAASIPSASTQPKPIEQIKTSRDVEKDLAKVKHTTPEASASACPADNFDGNPRFSTSSSFLQHNRISNSHAHHWYDGKNHVKPRCHPSPNEKHAQRASRPIGPTRNDVPPAARSPPSFHFGFQGLASEQHTPFGNTHSGYAPDDVSPRGEFTSRSDGRGDNAGSARNFAYCSDTYEFVPAPAARAKASEGQRWRSFSATPPRSPGTEHASGWSRGFGGGDYSAKSSPYGRVPSMHNPFGSSRSTAAHSMRSGPQSPFGSEQYPVRSPVRQSSRVEVLSSDAEEPQNNGPAPAKARSLHAEGIK